MKKGLLLLVLVFGGINMNAQTKIAHINSQELLDTLQSRKDAMAKLQKFEGEGVLELQEMNKSFESGVYPLSAEREGHDSCNSTNGTRKACKRNNKRCKQGSRS